MAGCRVRRLLGLSEILSVSFAQPNVIPRGLTSVPCSTEVQGVEEIVYQLASRRMYLVSRISLARDVENMLENR